MPAVPGKRARSVARGERLLDTVLVFTNLPDRLSALALAEAVLAQHAGACVNVLAPCTSVYRWQGKVETAEEFPVLIKTTAGRYAMLEATIRAAHPYELPEIIAVPIVSGLPAYLAWVAEETAP